MSLVYHLFLFGNSFFLFISLINAVLLDIPCTDTSQCGGVGAICRKTCQCDTPWYTPCNLTICDAKTAFVYEGEACRNDINCLVNAVCDVTEQKCRCKAGFTAINGLCYKSLNTSCANPDECWSGACRDGLCQCSLGFIPKGDNHRCQRKLAKIYPDWTSANSSGDFCYDTDSNSCKAPFAICQNDSQHSENFCQCPSTHTANYAAEKCELKLYNGVLSPTDTPSSSSDQGCSKCREKDAICVKVSNETKCWCRAGYIKKSDNECEKKQIKFNFPNNNDISQRNYSLPNCTINATNGSITANNGLCTCALGFKFVDRTSPCQPIKPVWQNVGFEYGVCTRINSNGDAVQESGLCPAPLQCQAKSDKYVCSCGRDKYLDEEANVCYNFLERNLTNPTDSRCPPNAILNGNKCQCPPTGIYAESTDNKRCELKLVETSVYPSSNCNYSTICEDLYGGFAQFCGKGECQCLSNSSYFFNNTCVTLLNVDLGTTGKCPSNSGTDNNSSCVCNPGYRAANTNRTCVRLNIQLNQTINAPSLLDIPLRDEDCEALFLNQSVIASNSTNQCICVGNQFIKNNICYFLLNSTIDQTDSSKIKCPENASLNSAICECNSGYKSENDTECGRLTDKLYERGSARKNFTGIRTEDCQALFGNISEATGNDGYCTCKDIVAFFSNDQCYFLVDTSQPNIDESACPSNSKKDGDKCICSSGYQAHTSKKGCERKSIYSTDLQSININSNVITCNSTYTADDCQSLHGIGAVCRNNKCYCDQSRSFVRANQCVLYSSYVFPGIHEHHLYTCDSDDDCGNDAEKNGIECGLNNNDRNYKVCKCKADYFYNANDGTCVKDQCNPKCSNEEECQGYQCICKVGFYRSSSGECVKFDASTKLYENCSYTIWNAVRFTDTELRCSERCERFECNSGNYDDGSKCVKYRFNDRCANNKDVCSQLSPFSTCNLVENKCTCPTGYYQEDETCVLPVNARCNTNEECGTNKKCIGRLCECDDGKKLEDIKDEYDRVLQRCININGVDQINFNPILFLYIVFAYVFFV